MAHKQPRYTVSVIADSYELVYDPLTLLQARRTAMREAKQPRNIAVYVMGWHGQCRVYLNPDGDFTPVGRCWVAYYRN